MNAPLVKLGDVCEVTLGRTPPRENPAWWGTETEGIPWVAIGDMGKSRVLTTTKERVSTSAIEGPFKGRIVPKGTLLLSFKLSIGKVCVLGMDAVHNEAIASIVPKRKDVHIPYLLHVLPLVTQTANATHAVKGKTLNKKALCNLDLPLPSLAEQERIVAHLERTLGAIDAMEAKFREMAETAERHFRATLAESFAALREKCPIQTLAELEDAGRIRLGRGQIISRKDLMATPGDYPVYSSAAVGEGIFGRYGKYMFEDPRITWSIDGGGRFFFRTDAKYSVTNVCGWLKVEDCKLDNLFLYYALYSEWVKKTFDYTHKAHPSVIRKEYDLPIPPLEEQERIANRLQQMRQQTATIAQRAGHAKEICGVYRRAVLSEAFGGGVGDE